MKNGLDKIIKKICKDFGWPLEKHGDAYAFDVTLSNDRLQTCSVQLLEANLGKIVHIQSLVGEFSKTKNIKLKELLNFQTSSVYARFSFVEHEDEGEETLVMIARTLFDSCTENELFSMIQDLASYADTFEQQIIGTDNY